MPAAATIQPGQTLFYARVSTRDQKADLQLDAARKLGIPTANIFVEAASGTRDDRHVLAQCLAALQPGDTLACYKLDRIGRSLAYTAKVLADLDQRGIHFRTVEDGLSTQGSTGKLILHVLAAVAQFEHSLILERARAGLDAAKQRGVRLGPPLKWDASMVQKARKLMEQDKLSAEQTARVLKVSRRTLFRGMAAARDHDSLLGASDAVASSGALVGASDPAPNAEAS
jgi:DNA invertase Pin-like site-specific DNA recombinase